MLSYLPPSPQLTRIGHVIVRAIPLSWVSRRCCLLPSCVGHDVASAMLTPTLHRIGQTVAAAYAYWPRRHIGHTAVLVVVGVGCGSSGCQDEGMDEMVATFVLAETVAETVAKMVADFYLAIYRVNRMWFVGGYGSARGPCRHCRLT
jgi:hypothetical protein